MVGALECTNGSSGLGSGPGGWDLCAMPLMMQG